MTTVGKIFAVLVLLMSLGVAGLMLVWYAKSTPWARAYQQASTKVDDAFKSANAAYAEAEKVKQQTKAELDKVAATLKKLQDDNDALRIQLADKDKQLTDEKNKN